MSILSIIHCVNLLKYLLFNKDINVNDIVRYSACLEYVPGAPKEYTKILIEISHVALNILYIHMKMF